MIKTFCKCGTAINAPESILGRALACEKCRAGVCAVSGEVLAEGSGGGDFDAHLVVQSGPSRVGEQFLLGGVAEITIGKLPDRQVILTGTQVSRGHCKLVRVDFGPSRWEIHDNKSTNGLFVNNQRIDQHELQHGDLIRVGDYELRYRLVQEAAPAPAAPSGPAGQVCPSCGNALPAAAKICVNCGVDVKTGRSLVVSKGLDEDDLAMRADTWIRTLSWIIPFGLFPIASEAFGTRKPWTTWTILGITILASVLFVITLHSNDEPSSQVLNLLQWNGQASAPFKFVPEEDLTPAEMQQLMQEAAASRFRPPDVGFRWYQPFTASLLHDPDLIMPFIYHLGGNMLFLLVFGLRVNELIGNWRMAIVYPMLALGSGLIDHVIQSDQALYPSLGASGAIMGLAGMYFVFFPVQRVHMAIWFRGGMLTRWQCFYKVFTMRGFWLLVLWIGMNDVLPTALGLQDSVAHWAHLGGFIVGVLLALTLLISRQVTALGGDLLSVMLGKRAWALVGKPSDQLAAASSV